MAATAAGFLLSEDGIERLADASARGLPATSVRDGLQGAMVANGFPMVSNTSFRRALAMVAPFPLGTSDRLAPLRRLAASERAAEAAVAAAIAAANPPWGAAGVIRPREAAERAARALAMGLPVPPQVTRVRASRASSKAPMREMARTGDAARLAAALARAGDMGIQGRASLGRLLAEAAELSRARVPDDSMCPVCRALLAAGAAPNQAGAGGRMPWDLARGRTSALIRAAADFSLIMKRPKCVPAFRTPPRPLP